MLLLNAPDVNQCLSMERAIEAMKIAFASFGRGDVVMPERMHIPVEKHSGEMLVMPSFLGGNQDSLAVKIVGVFPNNLARDLPSVMGLVCVFQPDSCKPMALLDGAALTAIRTAAVSAAATDWLAQPDASSLAIVGTGVQARSHLRAMSSIRNVNEVWIYGRSPGKAAQLIEQIHTDFEFDGNCFVAQSPDQAVTNAKIVCLVTSSAVPLFAANKVQPGTHINAIGSHSCDRREVPGPIVNQARIVVDQMAAALKSGDLAIPVAEGALDAESIYAELGTLAANHENIIPNNGTEITLFKSVGLAFQDAVAAQVCVDYALKNGIGQSVDW